jgi:alpha-beta hydrolase superfamily lysophospholipase
MTARLPRAEIHHYPSARHELLLELPDVVELLWQRVGEFINTQLEED